MWKVELRMQHLFAFIVHSPEEMPLAWVGHTLLFLKRKQNYNVTFSIFLSQHTIMLWVKCNKIRYVKSQTVLRYLCDTWMVAQMNGKKIMPIIHQHMCAQNHTCIWLSCFWCSCSQCANRAVSRLAWELPQKKSERIVQCIFIVGSHGVWWMPWKFSLSLIAVNGTECITSCTESTARIHGTVFPFQGTPELPQKECCLRCIQITFQS